MSQNTTRVDYENLIKNSSNYGFMPADVKKKWVSVSKKGVNPRTEFWTNKLNELILNQTLPVGSRLINLARYLHPTKKHVCKICGDACSIYYVYPSKNTWKWLNKSFDVEKTHENKSLTIFQLYEVIVNDEKESKFNKYFGMSLNELKSRCFSDTYGGKKLSPGVMGNPPDRLDGFHCYNSICDCRKSKDKGRSDENMKTYSRDRRAYEMMSDGNVLLANTMMGKLNTITSDCFMCGKSKKMTADHIGPISLGFIHDPMNFQACCSICNSSKNNRLTQEDVEKIKEKESCGNIMISWWAKDCWNNNKNQNNKKIQSALNKNAKKMLVIMEWLKENKKDILTEFITTNYLNHESSYKIEKIDILSKGDISYKHISKVSKKKTKTKQRERTLEILLEKNNKVNRKNKINLKEQEINVLNECSIDNFRDIICKVLVGI